MKKILEIDGEKVCPDTLSRTIDICNALVVDLPMKYSVLLQRISHESSVSYDYGRLAIMELEDIGLLRFNDVTQMEYLVK